MPGCVYHVVDSVPNSSRHGFDNLWRVRVFIDGDTVCDSDGFPVINDDGYCEFTGGILVATLYRRTLKECAATGIRYSILCNRKTT